jgi:dipeptidase D
MINLDTEEDAAIYIGCAGGADITSHLPLSRRRGLLASNPVRIAVRGLRGGHSGLNIIENRGNAIKFASRTLLAAIEAGIEVDLVALDGGSKHNAIPRESFATCRVHPNDIDRLRSTADTCIAEFREEFLASDPDFEIVIEKLEDTEDLQSVLNVHARDRLLRLLDAIPHGVLAMSREVPGLVESSNNLAVVATEVDRAQIITSHRSSIMPALHAIGRQVSSICRLAGADPDADDAYPGWKPNPDSPIVKTTARVFERVLESKPAIKAIHAGLECGLLIEKIPDMDAVSIGPEIQNAHSPEERVQISSVHRFYTVLKALLEELA